jgi:hypothetical protein
LTTVGYLLDSFFDPEYRVTLFLRNVGEILWELYGVGSRAVSLGPLTRQLEYSPADEPSGSWSAQIVVEPLGKASLKSDLAQRIILGDWWDKELFIEKNNEYNILCRDFGTPKESDVTSLNKR